MAKCTRGGIQEGGEESLGVIEGENEAKEIGMAGVGIFLVARRGTGGKLQE